MEVNIEYKGVELEVHGNYTPEEPMVRYYPDGSGYPGSPAEFEIEKIYFKKEDVFDIYRSLDELWNIEEKILETYEP